MFKTQQKHKAQHGGYRKKHTQKEVKANLDFWAGLTSKDLKESIDFVNKADICLSVTRTYPVGTQLKLF